MKTWVVDYAVKKENGFIDEDNTVQVLGKDVPEAYENARKEIIARHDEEFYIWNVCIGGDEDIDF